ncbi:MAG TPA: hypothetical protein VF590_16255 [Isosphaeraceae bacterium]|jgi:hypothetical protein
MRNGDPGPRRSGRDPAVSDREPPGRALASPAPGAAGWIIETEVSPFHCLYQDALALHSQSQQRLPRSEGEASRLARAALLLYLASAEALVHQAAVELGRPDLARLVADPQRPIPLADACRLLPSIVPDAPAGGLDPDAPPWPQFAELLALRASWSYPGPGPLRRAYYRSPRREDAYEPLEPHQIPAGLAVAAEHLHFPRTGLPRDPYALRPRHLDTARGILDAAIEALDRRLGGALTRDKRHRREPVRVVYPPEK